MQNEGKSTSPAIGDEAEWDIEAADLTDLDASDIEWDMDSEPQNTDSEPSPVPSHDEPLPSALNLVFIKNLCVAFIVAIATTVLFVHYKTYQCFIGYAITAYFVYLAVMIQRDFHNGSLIEEVVQCNSVVDKPIKKSMTVTFLTLEEEPHYYQFISQGGRRNKEDFIEGARYLIYFRPSNPKHLIAFIGL